MGNLSAFECFDDQHCATATGAWLAQGKWCGIILGRRFLLWCACPDQDADFCDVGLALSGSQQAVVSDAMEPIGQNMHEEPGDELVRIKPHDLHSVPAFDPVVLPSERHGVGICADVSLVRDRDTMGVSAEIGQHLFGPTEGRFGIDHPFDFAKRGQPVCKCTGLGQPF